MLDDIDRIEVISGPAGTLWGSNAVNGVINITTKSGRRALEGVKFDLRSEAGMSDVERDFGLARYTALVTDETGRFFCQGTSGPLCAQTFSYAAEQARINNAVGDFALNPVSFPVDPGATISGSVLRQRYQLDPWPGGVGHNAVAEVVQPKPFLHNSLDMTGRFGATRFFASGDNFRQEGAIRFLNGFERNAVRLNVDQAIGTDWSVALRTSYSRSTQEADGYHESLPRRSDGSVRTRDLG